MQAGLDSLGAVELRNAVASKFGINVPATLAFDYPTPTALSEFVAASLPQTLAQLSQEPLALATEESERAAVNPQEITERIHAILCGVLGCSILPHQPLMEVRSCHALLMPLLFSKI